MFWARIKPTRRVERRLPATAVTFEPADGLACLPYSIRAQTYPYWEAVVHDGPGPPARGVVKRLGDPRVRLVETADRKGSYGHPWRELGVRACAGDDIGLINGDDDSAPVFFEWAPHARTTR